MRRAVLALAVAVSALISLALEAGAYSPPFPGAKRRAEPTGRWYATVETWSDRCALVERAEGSPPLEPFSDSGASRFGMPGPDPVRVGDRVLVRGRCGAYPSDLLPASDGTGFAVLTKEFDTSAARASDAYRTLVQWIPVAGARVVLASLPNSPPKPGAWVGPSWAILRIDEGRVLVLREGEGDYAVVRVTDGAVRRSPTAPGPKDRLFPAPARVDAALESLRSGGEPARMAIEAAVRGDPATGWNSVERAHLVGRAYDLLGPGVAKDLAVLLGDEDANVRRAAYRPLANHRDVAMRLAGTMITDSSRPPTARAVAAWLLAEVGERTDIERLLSLASGPDVAVGAAAVEAIADRRWEAGSDMLLLLETTARGPHEEIVAQFFKNHVIPESARPLLAALRRSKGALRKTYAEALVTQTTRSDVGEDPDAWARALAQIEQSTK